MTDTAVPTTPPSPTPPPREGTAVRVATAVVGGTIALLVLVGAVLSQFSMASVRFFNSETPIASGVNSLTVDTRVGNVSVMATPGAQPTVTIEQIRSPFERVVESAITREGDELVIAVPDRDRPCLFFCFNTVSVIIELGDQELEELEISTNVGDIRLADVTAAEISAETNTGDIGITNATAAEIDADSDVGDITIALTEATTSLDASTDVGDVRIDVPEGLEYVVDARSTIGENRVDVPTAASASRSISATSRVGDVRIRVGE